MSESINLQKVRKLSENGEVFGKAYSQGQNNGHTDPTYVTTTFDNTDKKVPLEENNKAYDDSEDENKVPIKGTFSPDYNSTSNLVDLEAHKQYTECDDKDDDSNEPSTGCVKYVERVQHGLDGMWEKYGGKVKWIIAATAILAYALYFTYAMRYEFGSESSIRLLWMTLLGVFIVFVMYVDGMWGDVISEKVLQPITSFVTKHYSVFKIAFFLIVVLSVIIIITVEVAIPLPRNLISGVGYTVFITLFFIFSANPSKVRWRQVFWGLGLQFVFALLVIKTVWGYEAFKWIGDRISEFMAYTDEGSIFVFGPTYEDHMFAMKVMPVVIFFSTTISVLYYLGIMEIVISKIAWVMQYTMGTTPAESTNAAGNIFIGQTEAPLLIRPLINNMTKSEIHAVMVGGFATIAGSVLATYILYGVPANHLVTASVMAAPCALAMSKLSYPETQKTQEDIVAKMERPPYRNVIEAAAAGASAAIPLVANIVVNIIAFIAIISFFNTTLTWMGHRVGLWAPEYPELTFQLICSYLLWPFAYLMGVVKKDCRQIAELIGIKTFVNEYVAYTELGKLIDNTEYFNEYVANNGSDCTIINDNIYIADKNVTLYGGVVEDRSIVIATYALCGFANVASIGTVIGALGAMAPQKTSDISSMAVRAMVTGTAVSFMNACIAGLLYEATQINSDPSDYC